MRNRTGLIGVSAALGVAIVASACAGTPVAQEVARDKQVDTDMAAVTASGVPGVAIVIRDGGSTSRVAQGVGEVATNTPMRVADRVRIGSLAKSYVSVVLLQLAGENRLSLEDSIEKWVPGMVPNGATVTIRQLLNHSSGIANYEEHPQYLAPYLAGDVAHVTTPAQLIAMGTSRGPLFPPGTSSAYSNTNYTLAGLIIEKVTGSTLGAQFEQRIFGPLKLGSTYLPTGPEIDGQHAHGYFVLADPPATDVTRFSPSIGWAGGSIISTPDDVSAFYRALLEGRLLRPELLKQMMATIAGSNGEQYGLGLAQKTLPCGTAWGHGGNFPGYLVESYSSADARHQVTVAYNLDPNSMQQASKDAVERLLKDAFCGVKP
jgi:D-alanyl-D-alanine carboxypeptidase